LEIHDLADDAARARVRNQFTDADPDDLLLLDDLLGISDEAVAPPEIAPDARRRRLTALVNSASLTRHIAAVVGTERLRGIMAGLLVRSTAVVKRYGTP
jgi:adenylate cyclase